MCYLRFFTPTQDNQGEECKEDKREGRGTGLAAGGATAGIAATFAAAAAAGTGIGTWLGGHIFRTWIFNDADAAVTEHAFFAQTAGTTAAIVATLNAFAERNADGCACSFHTLSAFTTFAARAFAAIVAALQAFAHRDAAAAAAFQFGTGIADIVATVFILEAEVIAEAGIDSFAAHIHA